MLSIIAAVDLARGIGRDNVLPWPRLPRDLKRFKELTRGCPIIMGRKTFESIGSKPLPDRMNVVLTSEHALIPQVYTTDSFEGALRLTEEAPQVFAIGGVRVFEEALPHAGRICLTLVDGTFAADTFLPDDLGSLWCARHFEHVAADEAHPVAHDYFELVRLKYVIGSRYNVAAAPIIVRSMRHFIATAHLLRRA